MHSVSAVSSDMDNGGEFSGWDLKSNAWDWESHLPLPSRLGGRSNEWSDEHADSISEISGRNGQGSSCVTVQRDYSMEQSHQHNSFKIKVLSPGVKAETAKEMEQAVKEHRNLSSPDLTNKNGDETVEKKKNGCPEDDETGGNLERKKLFLGLGGDAHDKDMRKDGTTQDAAIGLGLGKRTYFSTAGAAAAAVTANKSSAGSSSSGRKLRGSSAHVPRCQVEGCKADLSSSIKEYHRRHKVCAAHSKSAKVIVNGEEQRFCQQCSRFHALTAFDEGKRSCRRRLAGHNERRRKPQADALSLASSSIQAEWIRRNMGLSRSDERLLGCGPPLSFFGLEDLQQKMTYGKSNWPRFGNIVDDHTNHVPAALSSNISRSAERLLMVLPRKAGIGVHQFMQGIGTETVTGTVSGTCGGGGGGGTGSMGQTLSLSSPSPQPPGLYNRQGVSLTQASQQGVQQGNSDSSCALSLLSSQSWAAASTQPSLDGSQQQHPQKANSTVSISHLIADNVAPPSFAHQSHHPRPHHHQQHQQQQQQQQQQVYRESSYDKLITEGSQNQESSSGFQGRLATIDLMNNPHSHSQCVDTVGVLKPYCSSIYNHHAM